MGLALGVGGAWWGRGRRGRLGSSPSLAFLPKMVLLVRAGVLDQPEAFVVVFIAEVAAAIGERPDAVVAEQLTS